MVVELLSRTTTWAQDVLLAVVKKNVLVLENLVNAIKQTDKEVLSKHRVLIIDDEADHYRR